jgi:hypothetical protein
LRGRRLPILFERRVRGGCWYVCEGGLAGTIGLPEDATDRGPQAGERPLSLEVLAELAGLVAALMRGRHPGEQP